MTPEVFAHLIGRSGSGPSPDDAATDLDRVFGQGIPLSEGQSPGSDRALLLVGVSLGTSPGVARIPPPLQIVGDVHSALVYLSETTVRGALAEASALRDRPRSAMRALTIALEDAPLAIVGREEEDPEVHAAAKELGVMWHPRDAGRAAPRATPPTPAPYGVPEAPLHGADHPYPSAPAAGHSLASPGRTAPRVPLGSPRSQPPVTSAVSVPPAFASGLLRHLERPKALRKFLLREFRALTGATRISLLLREGRPARLRLRAAVGLPTGLVGKVRCGLRAGLAGRATRSGRPVLGHGGRGGNRAYDGSAYVLLPLRTGRRTEGVLTLTQLPHDRLPAASTIALWQACASEAARALRGSRRLRRAEHLSSRDRLTGLPNRRAFERALDRELSRAQRTNGRLAVAIADIDHFKAINDDYGHAAGDRALAEVARRLKGALRGSDLVTRWGGEEFAMLLTDVSAQNSDEVLAALNRVREAVCARPIPLGPGLPAVTVAVSEGAVLGPLPNRTPADLLRIADQALYRAKDGGRNRVELGNPDE